MEKLKKVFLNCLYSFFVLLAIFAAFTVAMYPIKILSGPESSTDLLVKAWFPSIIIFLFPALTCVWANVIKIGRYSLSTSSTEGFLVKLKIWFISSLLGFLVMMLFELASALSLKWFQNFGLMLTLKLMAISSGTLVAEFVVVSRLLGKKLKLPNKEASVSDYQKYLNEVEEILSSENQEIDHVKFETVSEFVLETIKSNPSRFEEKIKSGRSVRVYTFLSMASRLGVLLESGQYHLHGFYGALNGQGTDMLKRFDRYTDELARLGEFSVDEATKFKQSIREMLKNIRR